VRRIFSLRMNLSSLRLLNNVRDLPKMITYSKELNDFLVQFVRQQIDMMPISCSYLYLHDP
jgi:hypothetical protein